MNHAPITTIPQLEDWSQSLRQVAHEPLECAPDFPAIARRFEAWWRHELIDRPIFIGETNADPSRPITRRLELLGDPPKWFEAKVTDLRQTHRVGDALPSIRVDFGAVLLGALFGGQTRFSSDTTWTDAFINDDWTNAPDWNIPADHPWWILLQQLADAVARDAAGRYLLRTPDLGGSADVLLNLRGSSQLCMDAVEQPDRLIHAQESIYYAWRQAFARLYEIVLAHGAGLIHWLGIWSNRPYVIPSCDFNFMIGPAEFEKTCLPDIARQAATVGRAVFHLDGAGAARHVDALLDVPDIHAIQFTPGAGSPSTLAWVDMFRRIQSKNRSLYIFCPIDEVVELCRYVEPAGLAIAVEGARSREHLDDVFARFRAAYSDTLSRTYNDRSCSA